MSVELIRILIALLSIVVNLFLINCLLETRQILKWYKKHYYSSSRISQCPVKYSWLSRIALALFTLKPIN